MEDLIAYSLRWETTVLAGAGCYVIGLLFRGQIILRSLVLLGTLLYIIYYAKAAEAPLWEAIFTSTLIGVANTIGLARYIIALSPRFISAKDVEIYKMLGCSMPGDFRTLMELGQRRRLSEEEQLTKEGQVPDKLFYIVDGDITIAKGKDRFIIPPRKFIGEVSVVLESSASVFLDAGSEIIEWDRKDLRRVMERDDQFRTSIEAMIAKDMAAKVAVGVASTE